MGIDYSFSQNFTDITVSIFCQDSPYNFAAALTRVGMSSLVNIRIHFLYKRIMIVQATTFTNISHPQSPGTPKTILTIKSMKRITAIQVTGATNLWSNRSALMTESIVTFVVPAATKTVDVVYNNGEKTVTVDVESAGNVTGAFKTVSLNLLAKESTFADIYYTV